MKSSIVKHGILLSLFALATTGLIALTHQSTALRIQDQEQQALQRILNEVIPVELHDKPIQANCASFTDPVLLGSDQAQTVYRATLNDVPSAVAIEAVAPDGYSGRIHLIVGVSADASVTGVRVLKHKETPGLGDKIDTRISDWVFSFDGKTLSEENRSRWQVKKDGGDFDAFTGATITPRAVVAAVARALDFFMLNQDAIYAASNQCSVSANNEAGQAHE